MFAEWIGVCEGEGWGVAIVSKVLPHSVYMAWHNDKKISLLKINADKFFNYL